MAEHGPFKTKTNAKAYAKKMRKKGFKANPYKTSKGWKVSVTTKK